MATKLCKNCKHSDREFMTGAYLCFHPNTGIFRYDTGKTRTQSCQSARTTGNCGKTAQFFESSRNLKRGRK